MKKHIQIAVGAAVAVSIAVGVGACSSTSKQSQPFQDAPVSYHDKSAAESYDMPDGFSNFSEKCDRHGNRVYIAYHGDSPYAAIAAVKDPTCG